MSARKSVLRVLSGLLALLTVGTILISCAEKADDENTPEVSGQITETEPEETDDGIEHDRIPDDLKFDGASLRMAGQAYHVTNNMDMWVETATGDVVLDAIYERGVYVSERLNVTIEEPLMTTYENCSKTVKNMVNAQEDGYEVVVNQLATTSSDVLNGYFYNLNDVGYIDFERSWYPNEITTSGSFGGKLFLTVSDMCLTYVGQTWSMSFNKKIATDNNIEDLYSVAREGAWTYDKLMSVSKDIYSDLNGNGKRDKGDLYGFTFGQGFDGCMAAAFVYGAGQRFLTVSDDGEIEVTLDNERGVNLAETLETLNAQEGSSFLTGYETQMHALMAGCAVFVPAQMTHYYSYARDFEGTFGVLPLPKLDEQQEGYYTLCDAGCNCITVPVTVQNTDLAGAAIEALSSYSHNYVNPKYVQVALQTKVARDDESAEMIQLVLDGRVMDFGYLYCGWDGWTWQLSQIFKSANTFASSVAKKTKAMNRYYEKVVGCFDNVD